MGPRRRHRPGARTAHERAAHVVVWLVLLSGCGAIYQLSSDYLYQPDGIEAPRAPADAETWSRDLEGGRVTALYLPPIDGGERAGAVIFAHGNRERVEQWPERMRPYREMGLAVLLPEYRGYGESTGEPSEEAIVDDFAWFYDRLIERPDIDESRVVFHGRSLGGGVVGVLSERRRAAALVLESTFTNVPDLASQWMAPAGAIRDRYDTREALLGGSTPVLVIHGVDDTVVPFQHAVELDRVAWDSTLLAMHADHHDVPRGRAYWRAVRTLLERTDVLLSE